MESVYAHVALATRERRPLCTASGRCCNFEKFGHRLYVTGLEAAYVFTSMRQASRVAIGDEPAVRAPDDRRERPTAPTTVSLPQIQESRSRGDCPFLVDRLCSVHAIKPLGCRVYFCDPSAQIWQQELSEEGLARIRSIHDRHGIEYRYAEWRGMLEAVVAATGA